ncbi:MAG TPA: fluoride efflux transporter CrcB [Planctomycetaceae bacterium]
MYEVEPFAVGLARCAPTPPAVPSDEARPVTPPLWIALLAVAAGGAVGAVCRYVVGLLVLRWHPEAGPLGTFAVNVAGCFLIGVVVPLVERSSLPPVAGLLLATGFLGALTTFSTFGHETVLLATARQRLDLALLNVAASLAAGIAAVWLGRAVVRWLAA